MPVLESYRGRDIIGVEELAGVATSLMEHYSRARVRGNVRLAISPRTVRHYLSESLLGEPSSQTATSIVFNYGNLLRLLAVKKLLADHWSVVKIKEFMRALDITSLEELVNGALASAGLPRKEGKTPTMHEGVKGLRTTDQMNSEDEQGALLQATPQLASVAVEAARRQERAVSQWVEIAPGLEIKVRRSFRAPASEQDRARLVTRFWSVIMKEE